MPLVTQPLNAEGKIEVPVICPTRDFQGAVAETIVTLWNTIWAMGRSPIYCQFQAHGYAFVRAGVFAGLKVELGKDVVRGFMIDDDVLLRSEMQDSLRLAMETADKFNWNFVSPYRIRDGFTSIAKKDGELLSVDEVRRLRPFDRVANGGLGFYYGDLPLGYKFHESGVFGGEDLNFFYENPQLDVRCVDLQLKHLKVCDLDMATPIPFKPRPRTDNPGPLPTAAELGIPDGEQPRIRE